MKLIQQLERKLSWRKKSGPSSPDSISSANSECSNNYNSFHYDKFSRKSKRLQGATMKVADSEFSQYIQFSNKNSLSLSLCPPLSTTPTYEIVSIRPRINCHQNQTNSPKMCDYRSSSPSCKDECDAHIYQDIEITRRNQPPSSQPAPPLISPVSTENPYSISSLNYETFGPTCRRSRIKTNPWLSSPWASKKGNLTQSSTISNHNVAIYHNSDQENNHYESIDDWHANKENNFTKTVLPPCAGILTTFVCPRQVSSNGIHRQETNHHNSKLKFDTFVKDPLHPAAPHQFGPRSTVQIESPDSEIADFCIPQAPSPEFVYQSQQLCSEISDYFNPLHLRKLLTAHSPHNAHSQGHRDQPNLVRPPTKANNPSTKSSQPSPPVQNKRRLSLEQVYGRAFKRHRPESIYSPKSKKLNQLKSQLKTVVHAAILEAKKEDNKKA